MHSISRPTAPLKGQPSLCLGLQQIQNGVARTVVKAPKSSLVTPILRSLHWLKINERIEYKLLSLTYKVLTTSQPDYLHNLISVQSSGRTRSSFCCHPSSTICIFVLRHYKSPTAPLDMHHLTFGINSRQPHCVHSPPGSPHPTYITSSQSSPSFWPSVTPSTFHSRLKTHLAPRAPFDHIWAMVWSGARGNITITAL